MDKKTESDLRLAFTRLTGALADCLNRSGPSAGSRDERALKHKERYLKDLAAVAKCSLDVAPLCRDYLRKYMTTIEKVPGLALDFESLSEDELSHLITVVSVANRSPLRKDRATLAERLLAEMQAETPGELPGAEHGERDGVLDEVKVYGDEIVDHESLESHVDLIAGLYTKHAIPVEIPDGITVSDPELAMKLARSHVVREELKPLPMLGGVKVFRFFVEGGRRKVSIGHVYE